MANNRRALIEGLNSGEDIDAEAAELFIAGNKPRRPAKAPSRVTAPAPVPEPAQETSPPIAEQPAAPAPVLKAREGKGQSTGAIGRSPLSSRIRTDYALALKRASLERQLSSTFPNTLQDILEEALEPWLRSKGYLT